MGLFGAGLNFGVGSNSTPVIDHYTNAGSFSWAKCPGAQAVGIIVIGGGGGGGNSTNTCTTGCGNYYYPGGGAGGGGGISSCLYQAAQVATCAIVTVGGGGSNGMPGADGGCSTFVGGVSLCAGGGRYGEGSSTPNSNVTNGGLGGGGTVSGAYGGAGRGTVNGEDGQVLDYSTRGGGGGGGARYCSVVPTSITYTSQGSASPSTSSYSTGWACIGLSTYGVGGMGGNASMNNQRSVNGTAGNPGMVYVIQYF